MNFSLIKIFRFVQNDENFLHKNCLLIILYTVNIWCAFDMNKNIVTRKFLKNFADEFNANYGTKNRNIKFSVRL